MNRGFQFARHPADLDVDVVLVGGRDHPLGSVAGGVPQRESAGSVAKEGLERLVRRVLAETFQLRRIRVENHYPALAGELAGEFPPGLPGADDDDPGEVVRPRRFALRGGVRAAFRHGGGETGTWVDSGPQGGRPEG